MRAVPLRLELVPVLHPRTPELGRKALLTYRLNGGHNRRQSVDRTAGPAAAKIAVEENSLKSSPSGFADDKRRVH